MKPSTEKLLIITILITFFISSSCNLSHKRESKEAAEAEQYLTEARELLSNEQHKLFNFDLYGNMVLAKNDSTFYSNSEISGFTPVGRIYKGTLPETVQLKNSIIETDNAKWALFTMPLPADTIERRYLLARTFFELNSPKIGFDKIHAPMCTHLNSPTTRLWMKIEAEALIEALNSHDSVIRDEHIKMALAAKQIRKVQTGAEFIRENNNELKLGTPHLVGLLLNSAPINANKETQTELLRKLQNSESMLYSFQEAIFPSYGLLMSEKNTEWIKSINNSTDIMQLVKSVYDISYSEDFIEMLEFLKNRYRGFEFEIQEQQREQKIAELNRFYRQKYLEGAFLFLRIDNNTSYSFDKKESVFIDKLGTISPNLTAKGPWGEITFANEALFNYNFSYLYLPPPFEIKNKTVTGEGWTLVLSEGYSVKEYQNSGKFHITQ